MSRRPSYDRKATVAMLKVSLAAGDTLKQAAFNANVTYFYAARLARETGLKFPRPKLGIDEARAAEMAQMFRDGRTLIQIGKHFKLSKQRVQQILSRRHGLTMADGGHWKKQRERRAAMPVIVRTVNTRVYFARCEGMVGPIKIGCSINPELRMATLSTWAPFPVELIVSVPGGLDIEGRVHQHFSDMHLHREWFRAEPRLLAAIDRLVAGVPLAEAIDLDDSRGPIRRPRKRSDAFRAHASYSHRLRHALDRASKKMEPGAFLRAPTDVNDILHAWCRSNYAHAPTDAELDRLEDVIDEPEKHGLVSRRPIIPNWARTNGAVTANDFMPAAGEAA